MGDGNPASSDVAPPMKPTATTESPPLMLTTTEVDSPRIVEDDLPEKDRHSVANDQGAALTDLRIIGDDAVSPVAAAENHHLIPIQLLTNAASPLKSSSTAAASRSKPNPRESPNQRLQWKPLIIISSPSNCRQTLLLRQTR
ncbi:OLC1v1025239C1 [Oldenlandia corymbosa var. corymbosa]|uniref:OLC1v1025239C1 n=1 Tax=Oldenlandia corymbosa var. corymbosa TaxID=529605 RepID=A0AAV1C6M2_OLDCO|nr:OLC1v1025239C1 [Oldenlandia corymbosa var. corymbosa]